MTKNTKQFKSSELKGMILQAFLDGKHTAPAAFRSLKNVNRNSFDVTVHHLYANGFLSRKKSRKPYHYTLTKKGLSHAMSPYQTKEWRAKRTLKEIDLILMEDARFAEAVERVASQMITNYGRGGGEGFSGVHLAKDDYGNLYLEDNEPAMEENVEMKIPTRNKPDGYQDHDARRSERIDRRSRLVLAYRDYSIDENFMRIWKGQNVYLMAGHSMERLKRGSIEMLGVNDQEVIRFRDKRAKGHHIKKKLEDRDIIACEIVIMKSDNKYVFFSSPYFRKDVVKKRW